MTESQGKALKFAYFILGITLPLGAYLIWVKGDRRRAIDKAHDITVEDSFPASDPPSAW